MKKLGKNIKPTKETVEAYACSCLFGSCSGCPCSCGGSGTASTNVTNGVSFAMGREVVKVVDNYV